MTFLKQLEIWVTGSDLNENFRAVRAKLTLFCFIFMALLFTVTGYSTYESTKFSLAASQPPEPPSFQSPQSLRDEIRSYNRELRRRNLERLQTAITINNASLVGLLTIFGWLSLYFILKPISDTYEQKEQFVKHASHELRTPLAILKSDLQLSLVENDIENIKKTNQASISEVDRLHNLASGLLGKLSQQQNKSQTVDMKQQIEEIWISLTSINQNNITLNYTNNQTLKVQNDPALLHQILFNILDNAVKYATPKTDLKVSINKKTKIVHFENQTSAQTIKPGVGMEIITHLSETSRIAVTQILTKEKSFKTTLKF